MIPVTGCGTTTLQSPPTGFIPPTSPQNLRYTRILEHQAARARDAEQKAQATRDAVQKAQATLQAAKAAEQRALNDYQDKQGLLAAELRKRNSGTTNTESKNTQGAFNSTSSGQAIMMSSSQFATLIDAIKPSETPAKKLTTINHPPLVRLQKEVRSKVDGRVVFNVTCLSPVHQRKLEQYAMRDDSHKTALGDGSFITRGVDLQPAIALSVDYEAVRHGLDAYIGLHGSSEFPEIRARVVDLQAWATKVWTHQHYNKRACRYINVFMQKYATQDNWSGLFSTQDIQLLMKYFYGPVDNFDSKPVVAGPSTTTVASVHNRQASQSDLPGAATAGTKERPRYFIFYPFLPDGSIC